MNTASNTLQEREGKKKKILKSKQKLKKKKGFRRKWWILKLGKEKLTNIKIAEAPGKENQIKGKKQTLKHVIQENYPKIKRFETSHFTRTPYS